MQMADFGITGVGMYVPEKVLTNEEIESWGIGSSAKWIVDNTGIRERRIVSADQTCGDIASLAAKEAMKNANIRPDEIDLIVMSTITPDFILPQTSAIVKHKIEAVNAVCFDTQAGCSGFVYALISAVNYAILNAEVNNILVIGADVFSKITDWSNRKLNSIFGDGAGAFVIQRMETVYGIKSSHIYHETMESSSLGYVPVYYGKIPSGLSSCFNFEGKYLYEVTKKYVPEIAKKVLDKVKWNIDEVDMFFFTHGGMSLALDIIKELGIPREKMHSVLYKFGYTANSCIPITIFDALECNKVHKGDKIVLVGAGVGSFFGGIAIEWAI
jgi:3-oxoacyl-[acyl-carrier-protein] synthase-3